MIQLLMVVYWLWYNTTANNGGLANNIASNGGLVYTTATTCGLANTCIF